MTATRALSAVAFLVSLTIPWTTAPALAERGPRIVVEPVLSRLDDGRATIRVSIANESPAPIVIEPGAIRVFKTHLQPGRRRGLRFSPMIRYPCTPNAASDGSNVASVTYEDETTIVFSTPEPWPAPPPTPVETPLLLAPGSTALSAPHLFGEMECAGRDASRSQIWAVYAVVTWHEPNSAKRSRIVSVVKRVDLPTTKTLPVTTEGQL